MYVWGNSYATLDTSSASSPSGTAGLYANANESLYERADADRLEFWAEQARRLDWETPFSQVLDWV
ncbi:MAG TPA: acetyl-coenzyme A synthetase N-terminal domain-containing protein [Bellilinea sp.]|nr:acetyl-coenzyme A synthetase N-terminal domain-containing protein [Bellilinea sp.]